MPDKKVRVERREQQAREIKASQQSLRLSIAETERLVDESDKMLKRHRKECEEMTLGIKEPGNEDSTLCPRSAHCRHESA